MTAIIKRYTRCSPASDKGSGLHFFVAAILSLLIYGGLTGCKPTEKNYRSAYDVAIEKRQRELREQEERRAEMGLTDATMQDVDGVTMVRINGRDAQVRHLNFARQDSVGMYAVSVGSFRMPGNAAAMAADLKGDGFPDTRALKGADNWYIVIGSAPTGEEALGIADAFKVARPDWRYVGQPGLLLLVGGAR